MSLNRDRLQLARTVLKAIGIAPPYADDAQGVGLHDRIRVQKLVYLAQELLKSKRMTLGYEYNWYLRGPYSPGLARDCYRLDETGVDKVSTLALRDDAAEAIGRTDELREQRPEGLDEHQWLELLASLHYFLTRTARGRRFSIPLDDAAIEAFRAYKSFEPHEIRAAENRLKGAGLIEDREETQPADC